MGKREKEVSMILGMMILIYAVAQTPVITWIGYFNYKAYLESGIYLLICLWIWWQPRQRPEARLKYQGNILVWAVAIGMVYLITVFLAGTVTGFANNVFSVTPLGILKNTQSVFVIGIMQQWIRAYAVHRVKKKYRKGLLIGFAVLYTLFAFRAGRLVAMDSLESGVQFYASYVLPKLALEGLLSYFTYLGGFLPAVSLWAIVTVPFYILPVVPNLNWLTHLLIKTLLPVFTMVFVHEMYQDRTGLVKDREKPKDGPVGWVLTSIFSIMVVWFVVGVFPVFPSVVMTGSMEPMIHPGDVVLVEKRLPDEIEKDDVMYFKSDSVFIIHRVIAKEDSAFRTKGDNNSKEDATLVQPEDVRGVMVGKIPYIGRLPLWVRGGRDDENKYEF